jgi:hypothetical protein
LMYFEWVFVLWRDRDLVSVLYIKIPCSKHYLLKGWLFSNICSLHLFWNGFIYDLCQNHSVFTYYACSIFWNLVLCSHQLCFLLMIALSIQGLCAPYDIFPSSVKNVFWILLGIILDLRVTFTYCHNINLIYPWTWVVFSSSSVFLNAFFSVLYFSL